MPWAAAGTLTPIAIANEIAAFLIEWRKVPSECTRTMAYDTNVRN